MDLATAADLLVAGGTGGLAIFTWRLASGTADLVKAATEQAAQTERAAKAAEESTAAATASVREATRARLDARAPRVVAICEPPAWPPFIDKGRRAMPLANEARLLSAHSLRSSPEVNGEYIFDQDREHFMWFRCSGRLRNEGAVTARVRLNGEAQFLIETTDELPPSERELKPIASNQSLVNPEHLLPPGKEVHFEWAAGHTLGEWADAYERPNPPNSKGALMLSIEVADPTGLSVGDTIYIVAAGRPIEPVPDKNSHWRPVGSGSMDLVCYPTVRRYVGEDESPTVPPWDETYK